MGRAIKVRQTVTVQEVFNAMTRARRGTGWTANQLAERLYCSVQAVKKSAEELVASGFLQACGGWGQQAVWKLASKRDVIRFAAGDEGWLRQYHHELMSIYRLNYPRGPRDGVPIVRSTNVVDQLLGFKNESEESEGSTDGTETGGHRPEGRAVGADADADDRHGQGARAEGGPGVATLQAGAVAKWDARAPVSLPGPYAICDEPQRVWSKGVPDGQAKRGRGRPRKPKP